MKKAMLKLFKAVKSALSKKTKKKSTKKKK